MPCIGDNVDDIRKTIASLRGDRASLETALAGAQKNFNAAAAGDTHLKGSAPNMVKARAADGGTPSALAPRDNSNTGASDITGTRPQMQDDQATKQILGQ